ncbi:MAG: hydrolase 2, exosortase A system-associated [Betaproteobacteria bacterium]|nr:hydrolase 2, exosortase A system-associated [Betaproteobacteria bacterium]
MGAWPAARWPDAGCAVLQLDLLGCGDSSGDFGDATWAGLGAGRDRRAPLAEPGPPGLPLWLWGLRCGALLAAQAREQIHPPPHLLLWQPVQQGRMALQQFLRLKAAAQLADGGGKAIMDAVRRDLAAGQAVDVAGYTLAAELAQALEAAQLVPPSAQPGRLVWLEVAGGPDAEISPAAAARGRAGRPPARRCRPTAVAGPAFWQTTEIEDAPALVAATVQALADAAEPPA